MIWAVTVFIVAFWLRYAAILLVNYSTIVKRKRVLQ